MFRNCGINFGFIDRFVIFVELFVRIRSDMPDSQYPDRTDTLQKLDIEIYRIDKVTKIQMKNPDFSGKN